jgi:lipoprotein-releasing system permease protein
LRYELTIALRYLRARRKNAFISITTIFTAVGVMIGVAALIIVLSVMNGFESNLRERVLSLSPQVQILNYAGAITDYDRISKPALAVPGVIAADPFLIGQGLVSSGRGVSGVLVRGMRFDGGRGPSQLRRFIRSGSIAGLVAAIDPKATGEGGDEPIGVAIGQALSHKLRVNVGDRLRIVAPILTGSSSELSTRTGQFVIVAIFESGISYIDSDVIFADLARMQDFLGRQGRADGIELGLANLDQTNAVTARLRKLFPHPFRVRDWIEFNQSAAAGFEMLKRIYTLVMLMLIGVAAFNLIATLIMVVMEKRKDIAVLLTMGAAPRNIAMIFVFKGLIVGLIGTGAGLVLGSIGCFVLSRYHFIEIPKEIYQTSSLPIQVSVGNFAAVAIASIALCLLATLYPARQASRQTPVEILRA